MTESLLVMFIVAATTLAAVFFTVVPVLPGTLLVPLGGVACAYVLGWGEIGWWFWAVQAACVVAALLVDNVAQLLGVRRVGGSREAMWGGAIGVFVGPFVVAVALGPLALLLGPPIGAVAGTLLGERYARRHPHSEQPTTAEHVRLGTAAVVAFVVGTTVKLGIVLMQVVVLYVATR